MILLPLPPFLPTLRPLRPKPSGPQVFLPPLYSHLVPSMPGLQSSGPSPDPFLPPRPSQALSFVQTHLLLTCGRTTPLELLQISPSQLLSLLIRPLLPQNQSHQARLFVRSFAPKMSMKTSPILILFPFRAQFPLHFTR